MSSEKSNLRVGLMLLLVAFFISAGMSFVLSGINLDAQLDLFEWTVNMTDFESEIQDDFERKKQLSSYFVTVGASFLAGSFYFIYRVYRDIK